jgi:hypothetical protein
MTLQGFPMKQLIERFLLKIYDLLPKKLRIRSYFIFWLFLPFLLLKIGKRLFFRRKPVFVKKDLPEYGNQLQPININSKTSNEEVCIRYSGGTDSTLVTARMALIFKRVHLLTFNTSYEFFTFKLLPSRPLNVLTNLELLKNHFGADKFIHSIVELDSLRDDIYFNTYLSYLLKNNFLRVSLCPACSLAMHLKTILYCKINNIRFITDGSNIDSGALPWQTQHINNLLVVQNIYRANDLSYIINPDYLNPRSSEELFEIGVFKKEVDRSNFSYRRKTQQFCMPIQLQSICRKLHGSVDNKTDIEEQLQIFFKEGFEKHNNNMQTKKPIVTHRKSYD